RKADIRFLSDLITTLPLLWIIKNENATQRPKNMLIPNLKIAQRTLLRNKLYTIINLGGLSVSLAACLLIALFVRDETSFDRQFKDYERIYRLGGNYQQGGDARITDAATTFLLHPLIEEQVSGIESLGRLDFDIQTINIDEKDYIEEVAYVDSTFFDIFSLPFIQGDPASALDEPSSVVIDRQTAVKFFGDANPMGKSIVMKDKLFTVSGVMDDMAGNVHFEAHILFPVSGIKRFYPDWVLTNISARSVYTYIKTNRDINPSDIKAQCDNVIKAAWPVDTGVPQLFLQPISKIHLSPPMQGELKPNGTETDVYIFCITAFIILCLACINYINLSMAAALPRSREAGIKRVLGSTARMIINQFQTESFLVLLISGLLALLIAWSFMPMLNELSGKHLTFEPWADRVIGFGFVGVIVSIAFVAGIVPALTLLRSGTIRMLSGKLEFKPGRYPISNVLIVFQFTIAVGLIASTLIVMDQIRFIRNANIGINTEQLIMIPMQTGEIASKYEAFRSELMKDPGILSVTGSTNKLTGGVHGWRGYKVNPAKDMITIPTVTVAHDFFETLGAQVHDGRTFSRDFPSDGTAAYVVNEAAAELLELEKPVGAYMFGLAFNNVDKWTEVNAHIIGVVKNFHFASLHRRAGPVVFSLASDITPPVSWLEVRIKGDDVKGTISSIGKVWSSLAASRPFEYEFMDEALRRYYIAEEQFMKLFISFSLLSILLGALGLFGLTAFMTKRRTKEIGIRKVIGASTSKLIRLLSGDFLKLVLIGNIIGLPIAWYYMDRWLQNFVVHANFKWWIFAGTMVAAMMIAFTAILYHSMKVSKANPVKALRTE
ncbi:MAG TPA: FtsX-like permease family protein, partial [Chryseolinea sp.]|nr:FtsX-like permease family protein [Chryseolinea sp.]